jgi:hypothetical protein
MRGNPGPLIAHFLSRKPLSDGEIQFIVEALEATGGKRQADELRELEKKLIALQVDALIDEDGLLPKQAIDEVAKHRGRSIRHIRTALAAYGKPRRPPLVQIRFSFCTKHLLTLREMCVNCPAPFTRIRGRCRDVRNCPAPSPH